MPPRGSQYPRVIAAVAVIYLVSKELIPETRKRPDGMIENVFVCTRNRAPALSSPAR